MAECCPDLPSEFPMNPNNTISISYGTVGLWTIYMYSDGKPGHIWNVLKANECFCWWIP